MAKNENTKMLIGVAVVVVVVVIGAFFLLNQQSSTLTSTILTTIPTQNLTSTAVTSLITTIVINQTTATGQNLASCNGYNYSISTSNQNSVGSCNWRAGLMNVSIFGGSFTNTSLTLVQQNVTSAPYNATFSGSACSTKSGVFRVTGGITRSLSPQGCYQRAAGAEMRLSD
jgi:hypothetical protein